MNIFFASWINVIYKSSIILSFSFFLRFMWLIRVFHALPLGKPLSIGDRVSLPSVAAFTQIYETIPSMSILPKFDVKQIPMDSERLLNASNQYAEATADVLITFYGRYGWLLKATMSGLVITGFTWFILYKDSSEPGVNPPSPFSPSRQR